MSWPTRPATSPSASSPSRSATRSCPPPSCGKRQEFAFEAAVRMRDRFLQQEVWERMGLNVKDVLPMVMQSPERAGFQAMLFSKIVPNCKKLGLLDAGATNGKPGWLREKFTELGVIAFEDWADT